MPAVHGNRNTGKIKSLLKGYNEIRLALSREVRSNNERGVLQELKWDTLETMRRHTGLSVINKMCYDVTGGGMEGLFDSIWRKENTRKPPF